MSTTNEIHEPCEICKVNAVEGIQGGVVNGERGLWMCCKECADKIIDERRSHNLVGRRTNGRIL